MYTGVIDSYYENKDNNITLKILKENNISLIDMICWSHPDMDHSKGVSDLFKLTNHQSSILIPETLTLEKNDVSHAFPEISEFLNCEYSKRTNKKDRRSIETMSNNKRIKNLKVHTFKKNTDAYLMDIIAFAPDSELINRFQWNPDLQANNNEFSVGLWLQLGEASVLFASDVNNRTFGSIPNDAKYFPKLVDYLKIPHHGSLSSEKILAKISNQIEVSCTTVFNPPSLPDIEVLNKYKKRSKKLFCTNSIKKKKQQYDYGIIKISIDISSPELSYNYTLEGNAELCCI